MSSNDYRIHALTPAEPSQVASLLPWGFKEDAEATWEPGFEFEAVVQRPVMALSVTGGEQSVLEDCGLPSTLKVSLSMWKGSNAEDDREFFARLLEPVLAELFRSGPSWGLIADEHVYDAIYWSPDALYVNPNIADSAVYNGMVDQWPGIAEVRTIEVPWSSHGQAPWLSARLSQRRLSETMRSQFDGLLAMWGKWDRSTSAAPLLGALEKQVGPIRKTEVFVPALLRTLEDSDQARWANAAFYEWCNGNFDAFDDALSHIVSPAQEL